MCSPLMQLGWMVVVAMPPAMDSHAVKALEQNGAKQMPVGEYDS